MNGFERGCNAGAGHLAGGGVGWGGAQDDRSNTEAKDNSNMFY